MIYEVRPLVKDTWMGSKTSGAFHGVKTIRALVDPKSNRYMHGLSEADKEHLVKEGVTYDLSDGFNAQTPHPFWDSNQAVVKLEDKPMYFDTANPMDFIKIHIMIASKYVANSQSEYDQGLWPYATHVIYNDEETYHAKAQTLESKQAAIVETAKLNRDRKNQIVTIMTGKSCSGRSDDFVNVTLYELIEEKAAEVLSMAKRSKEELASLALVLELRQRDVIRIRDGKLYYFDTLLGETPEIAAKYLKKPENQELQVKLMQLLNKL